MYEVEYLTQTKDNLLNPLHRGDIVLLNFGKQHGYIQGGIRPAVIIQNDTGNYFSPTTIVAPITSKNKKYIPTHVKICSGEGKLNKDSIILAEQVSTVNKHEIIGYIGHISDLKLYEKINKALSVSLAI